MGWKGTLRSINAASNRAARESEKRANAVKRDLAKIDRNVSRAIEQAQRFDDRAHKDPIKAFALSYDADRGFESTPFALKTDVFTGQVQLLSSGTVGIAKFRPQRARTKHGLIQPLDVNISQWATVVALRLESLDRDFRFRSPWFKKSDPRASSVYLIDPSNNLYYYPIASTLSGETLPGHPRTVLIAFEPFRLSTDQLQVCFSEVKLSPGRSAKHSFEFRLNSGMLATGIEESLQAPPLPLVVGDLLEAEAVKLRRQASTGCLVIAATFGTIAATCLLVVATVL